MAAYLVELRHPKGEPGLWFTDFRPKTRKDADKRARQIENGGWQVRVTRTAPEPTVDHKTGALREKEADEVLYVTAGA